MDRRRFIGWMGAATAASLAGCGGGGGSSPAPAPTGLDWTGLSNGMDGKLILPGNPLYAQAAAVANKRYEAVQPQAVARCASPDDVKEVLAFVRANDLAVTPRCGGHSFGGYSTGTGVVLDVTPMNAVQVNSNGTCTIGAGARLADVYDQLTAQGVSIPTGTCPTVGISGITMGGGISFMDRKYGLTCDNLVSARMVTADGRLLDVSETQEPDLFWALRGGGGGNFGVVTSFTFKTHVAQDLTEFLAGYAFSDLHQVLDTWQNWQQGLPDEIWSFLVFSFFSPNAPPSAVLYGVSLLDEADLLPYWNAFKTATGVTPAFTSTARKSYRDVMLAGCGSRTVSQCHMVGLTPDATMSPYYFASTSGYFNQPMPSQGIDTLLTSMDNARMAGVTGQVLLDVMGGALGRVAKDATAFWHRDALFSAEYYMDAPPGAPATWHHEVRTAMAPWSSGGAYVNYIDPLITDWQTAYYGGNYAKLVQVKAAYDPNELFKFAQGIPAR
jgi:FAD/FMN-containing dehydrogenase